MGWVGGGGGAPRGPGRLAEAHWGGARAKSPGCTQRRSGRCATQGYGDRRQRRAARRAARPAARPWTPRETWPRKAGGGRGRSQLEAARVGSAATAQLDEAGRRSRGNSMAEDAGEGGALAAAAAATRPAPLARHPGRNGRSKHAWLNRARAKGRVSHGSERYDTMQKICRHMCRAHL